MASIGDLPKHVIESILDRMPIGDAVRTSVLSRDWRYNWSYIKNLNFPEFFSDKARSPAKHVRIAYGVLLQHRGVYIDRFAVELPQGLYNDTVDNSEEADRIETAEVLSDCLEFVSKKHVKDVVVDYDWEVYPRVPTPLFSCSELTNLKLVGCLFKTPHCFRGFPNLAKFKCIGVDFPEDSFQCLVSSCPLLGCLKMVSCTGNTKICSEKLKHLEIVHASSVDIAAKNLEKLAIYLPGYDDDSALFRTPFLTLKKLEFSMDFGAPLHLPLLLCLFDRAPNLQELQLNTSSILDDDMVERSVVNIRESMNQVMDNLRFVRMSVLKGLKNELFLIRQLLALSPSLEKMVVVQQVHDDRTPPVFAELMSFPRISPNAQINYFWDSAR